MVIQKKTLPKRKLKKERKKKGCKKEIIVIGQFL